MINRHLVDKLKRLDRKGNLERPNVAGAQFKIISGSHLGSHLVRSRLHAVVRIGAESLTL
jgi:hypothetical protein